MGRKSERSQLRAALKKEEKVRLKAAQESVKKANDIKDPLADFPVFQKFEKNGVIAHLECKNVTDLDKETVDKIFKMEKDNMEQIYNNCSWGWNEEKKFKEMTESSAKYLIARDINNDILGFSHFRFDMDYGDEVLYCYELQLDRNVRRKGLGKFLLQVLELMAFKNNMRKVVLTVLKHNTDAVDFFHSMKYTSDETNPVEGIYEEIPYEILSKINKKLPPIS